MVPYAQYMDSVLSRRRGAEETKQAFTDRALPLGFRITLGRLEELGLRFMGRVEVIYVIRRSCAC